MKYWRDLEEGEYVKVGDRRLVKSNNSDYFFEWECIEEGLPVVGRIIDPPNDFGYQRPIDVDSIKDQIADLEVENHFLEVENHFLEMEIQDFEMQILNLT